MLRSVILQAGGYSVMAVETGVARCPYDPSHNSTSLYVGRLSCFTIIASFCKQYISLLQVGPQIEIFKYSLL